METTENIFVPSLQPALKHPTILSKFDDLENGQAFILINDHDPIPLYYEMKAVKGDIFEWNKIEDGPDVWKVEIRKTRSNNNAATHEKDINTAPATELSELNVTLIEPKLKHPTIFKHFDALKEGESFVILNDHDPKPLYYQMIAERGNIFSWAYLEKGPRWWKVQIKKNDLQNGDTVGEIAAKDLRKAEVFKKYGIDFCCGGKKSLRQACDEKGLDISTIESELVNAQEGGLSSNDYNSWNPAFLADYIYNQHHQYYYKEVPVIKQLLAKVAGHHEDNHPELNKLQEEFLHLLAELNAHFAKEERVVFPFIKALQEAKMSGDLKPVNELPSVVEAILLMESDHEAAGVILADMREITSGYTLPADACNSYAFLFKKLKELDEDLQQHIHLENNILFPKALKLDKELRPVK